MSSASRTSSRQSSVSASATSSLIPCTLTYVNRKLLCSSRLATSTKTAYKAIKITPAQTLLILRSVMGNMLHFTLVFVVAATALRSSEALSLRWADILWEERKIRIVKSWKKTGGR